MTFGVTNSEVVSRLPINPEKIGATTQPLSTTDIDLWIDEADADFAGALNPSSDPAALDETAKQQIKNGIIAYAVSKSYEALGFYKDAAKSAYAQYEARLDDVRSSPRTISGQGSRVRSNIQKGRRKRFVGRDYKF